MTGPEERRRPEIGDWADADGLRRVQDEQLGRTLEAAARSPFYRRRGVPVDRAGLENHPLTTKQDLRNAYPFGLLAVDREQVATYHESSGSTGTPTASYYTEDDWADLVERWVRKHIGVQPADTFLVRTPYALMLTGHLAHAGARSRGATVVPADNRSLATPFPTVVRLLRDLGVTITWSLPADTLLWAATAAEMGLKPGRDFPALRALFTAGEPLSPARQARIAAIWGVPVVDEYGASELGALAGHCPHDRLHLWADRAIVEVHDPATGRTTPYGRGQLVVTPLYREAMPLLRYNIEDEVEVSDQDCPCGWRLPTVRVLGRTAFGGPAGLTQLAVEQLVFELPIEYGVMFWRARPEGDRLRLQIEVGAEHRVAAVSELAAAVETAYAMEVVVDGLTPGTLVPRRLLTAEPRVMKPRGLFTATEDWDRAIQYY